MMRRTKVFIMFLMFFVNAASANENILCLDHLGGGMSDVYCYMDLIKKNGEKSILISKKILSTMPKHSKYKKTLIDYMKDKHEEKKYCSLAKASQNSWDVNDALGQNVFNVNDVDYYACVYDQSVAQVKFLTHLLDGVSPQ